MDWRAASPPEMVAERQRLPMASKATDRAVGVEATGRAADVEATGRAVDVEAAALSVGVEVAVTESGSVSSDPSSIAIPEAVPPSDPSVAIAEL